MDYKVSAEAVFKNIRMLGRHVTMRNMTGVSKGEMAILGYLHFVHDGATAGELSETSCVVSSRIAAVLNALEKKDWAVRKPDPEDKRRVLVYITELGRQTAEIKHKEVIEGIANTLSVIGEEDTQALLRILEKLVMHEENAEL